MACGEGRIPSGVRTREAQVRREGCAQSEQRRADGGCRPPRRGGGRMKRSFPPRFYRERRDIPTLSVPSKKGAFMHDRARNERRRTYGNVIAPYSGVDWRDVNVFTIGPNSKNARL